MGPDGEFDLAVGQMNVGMVFDGFGQLTYAMGEFEAIQEIFEFVFFFQVMLADDLPVVSQLGL